MKKAIIITVCIVTVLLAGAVVFSVLSSSEGNIGDAAYDTDHGNFEYIPSDEIIEFPEETVPLAPDVQDAVSIQSISVKFNKKYYRTNEAIPLDIVLSPANANEKYTVTVNSSNAVVSGNSSVTGTASGEVEVIVTSSEGVVGKAKITFFDASEYQQKVLSLINSERQKKNLSALSADNTGLNDAACKRATETVSLFSHSRPDGTMFYTVYQEYNVPYRAGGENIAYGYQSAEKVMNGWMNSSGHKDNILGSSFTHVGIGVDMDDNGLLYWVQVFLG